MDKHIFNFGNRSRLEPRYYWWKIATGNNYNRAVWEFPSDYPGMVTPLGIENRNPVPYLVIELSS
jgi:hypothetical protein